MIPLDDGVARLGASSLAKGLAIGLGSDMLSIPHFSLCVRKGGRVFHDWALPV